MWLTKAWQLILFLNCITTSNLDKKLLIYLIVLWCVCVCICLDKYDLFCILYAELGLILIILKKGFIILALLR